MKKVSKAPSNMLTYHDSSNSFFIRHSELFNEDICMCFCKNPESLPLTSTPCLTELHSISSFKRDVEIGMSQSDQEFCFILAMKWVFTACQGMPISLTSQIRSAAPECQSCVPHSANPSLPAHPAHSTLLSHFIDMLGCVSPSLKCPVHLFSPLTVLPVAVVVHYKFTKNRRRQTHLLVSVGSTVREGAGCLSSCSGLWGRSGQRVYAKVGQKQKNS